MIITILYNYSPFLVVLPFLGKFNRNEIRLVLLTESGDLISPQQRVELDHLNSQYIHTLMFLKCLD